MIAFTQDKTDARRGFDTVYVDPDEVSAVVRNQSEWTASNKSILLMKTGDKIPVQDYPSAVVDRLGKGKPV